jgi:tRNA-splicing ligase RtcB
LVAAAGSEYFQGLFTLVDLFALKKAVAIMSNFKRIHKAFARQGISLSRADGVYRVSRGEAAANILLPESFPLEQKAVKQLLDFASVHFPGHSGHVCKACATPDIHPGSIAPVGTVVAASSDFVIPHVIGTDINCGIRLISTNIPVEQAQAKQGLLEKLLIKLFLEGGRDVPVSGEAFQRLFDNGPEAFLESVNRTGIWSRTASQTLIDECGSCIGLDEFTSSSRHAPPALLPGRREVIRDPGLGAVGSGNHFVEFGSVDTVLDKRRAYELGIRQGTLTVMIHTGSRDVGFYVGGRWMDRARAEWPAGLKHPSSGLYALTGPLASEYLEAMGTAARYAWLNRVVLQEMVRQTLSEVFNDESARLVVDVPHNVVLREHGFNVHRKGATPARNGDLALIPGSMGDFSHLANGLGNVDWLSSCSHGAGRSVRRQTMRAVKPGTTEKQDWHCVTLKEERKIEEAPSAYKPVGPVIESQEQAGLISAVARLKPWLTLKA